MEFVFLKLLNMSISAGWLILAVAAARLLLKKAPRWIVCMLWGIVAVRLICPISPESIFSLIPSAETIHPEAVQYGERPVVSSGISLLNSTLNPAISGYLAPAPGDSVSPLYVWTAAAGFLWALGLAVMLICALISYLRLRHKLREGVLLRENIWVCDAVSSPFILGIVRPRIYLSSSMEKEAADYVIIHERAHLRRRDSWWKPLGYILLAVYWFSPLCWLAYILFCRDIEFACDEKAIRNMDFKERKAYSTALLSCSVQKRLVTACPLAFGEVGVKDRVKSVLNYRKPGFWVIILGIGVTAALAVCFLTDPVTDEKPNLRLEDVIALSQKGEELTWSDFEDYAYREVGSGLWIQLYEIDDTFSLLIGGGGGLERPMYIYLKANHTEPEEFIDIRVEDVEAFIERYSENQYSKEQSEDILDEGQGSGNQAENSQAADSQGSSNQAENSQAVDSQGSSNQVENSQAADSQAADSQGSNQAENSQAADSQGSSNQAENSQNADNQGGNNQDNRILTAEDAICKAILEHNASNYPEEYDLACCSFVTLETMCALPVVGDTTYRSTYYGWALYQEYKITEAGIETVSGSHVPVSLSFDYNETGYTLTEYWEPGDGSYYVSDIQENCPSHIVEDMLDSQKFILEQMQDCYHQAIQFSGLNTSAVIDKLLDTVCSGPLTSSNPYDYIQAHSLEYRELIYYGEYAVQYREKGLAAGTLQGLEAEIMDIVCSPEIF